MVGLSNLWQIINPLRVSIILEPNQLRGQLERKIEFLLLAGLISQQSWQQGGPLNALQAFSSREHIPPSTASLFTDSQRNGRIMWPLTREAPAGKKKKLFYLLLLYHLLLAVICSFSTVCLYHLHVPQSACLFILSHYGLKQEVKSVC